MRSINKAFGDRFKILRRATGLTQKQMLKDFNRRFNRAFTAAAISQYENGKRIPEIDSIMDFAAFFNVSTDYLLGKDESTQDTDIKTGSSPPKITIMGNGGIGKKTIELTQKEFEMFEAILKATREVAVDDDE